MISVICSLLGLHPALWGFCTFFWQDLGLVPAAGRALLYKENRGELFRSFPILKMYSFVDVIFF